MRINEDVEDFAYIGNQNIDYITIGEDVRRIGERAFANSPKDRLLELYTMLTEIEPNKD